MRACQTYVHSGFYKQNFYFFSWEVKCSRIQGIRPEWNYFQQKIAKNNNNNNILTKGEVHLGRRKIHYITSLENKYGCNFLLPVFILQAISNYKLSPPSYHKRKISLRIH